MFLYSCTRDIFLKSKKGMGNQLQEKSLPEGKIENILLSIGRISQAAFDLLLIVR